MAKQQTPAQQQKQNPLASAVQNSLQPPQQHQVQVQHVQQVQTIFDPEVVQKYSLMVPDAPERILAILEKNNAAEIRAREAQDESVKQVNQFHADDNKRRDWMAFLILVLLILASGFFAYLNHQALSVASLTGFAYLVVSGFLKPKHQVSPPQTDNE